MSYTNNEIKASLNRFKDAIEQSIPSPIDEKNELLNQIETYIQNYENSIFQTLKRDRFIRKIKKNKRILQKMIFIDNKILEFGPLTREDIIQIANQWELTELIN